MSPETPTSTKLCPTCGTRVSEAATRCLVCGADLGSANKPAQASKAVQGSRMPEITLSLPGAIGLLALFLTIGAVLVYYALRSKPEVVVPMTPTVTVTITPTSTQTPTPLPPTPTDTPMPTPTPVTYKVATGDNCIGIANFFKVSVQSIVTLNNLPQACDTLYPGQPLLIPQPTPTATALPSATLSQPEQTLAACQTVKYTVQEGDTLGNISANYVVPMEAIREFNGLSSDTVFFGQDLIIPLCERPATPGPSPTPTLPPPYPAPNLLLPPDGAPFTLNDDSVTLQWASVGTLRENESYQVIVEDVTEGKGRKLIDYVTDTKYIVQATFRSSDNTIHVYRWWILTVRQSGSDADGKPLYVPAGAISTPRDFIWTGTAAATTPTP